MNDTTEIKEMLKEQGERVEEIHFAIFGNTRAGVKGIAEIVKDNNKYIQNDKKLKWVFAGATLGGWTGILAYIRTHFGI